MVAASVASTVALVAGIIGVIVGLAGIASVIMVMGRYKALEKNVELFSVSNAELRGQVEADRKERNEMRSEFDKKLADERAECARALGEMQGQISVLTQNLGRDIAKSVLDAFKDGQASTPPFQDETTLTVKTTSTEIQ